jgi:hypothetical protein
MLKDIGVDRAEGGVRPVIEPVREGGQDLPLEVRPGWTAVTALMSARSRSNGHARLCA